MSAVKCDWQAKRDTRMESGKSNRIRMLVMWGKRVESRIDRLGWYDCTELLRVEWLQSEGLQPATAHTDEGLIYTPVIFKKPGTIWA